MVPHPEPTVPSADGWASKHDPFAAAVEFIVRFGLAERLLVRHVPDECGRCRACTLPGYGTPHLPWPCLIHVLAAHASGVR